MTLYSVFDRRRDEAPAVVPDRFSWFAALLPPVFALVHGLWLVLVAFAAFVVLLALAAAWLGPDAVFWLYVIAALAIGWHAPALRRRALRRRGWVYRTEMIADAAETVEVDWVRRRGASA